MTVLTALEKQKVRNACSETLQVNYTKIDLNNAVQGVEDWFEANKTSLNTAINTATDPFVFTAAQKKKIVAEWANYKFNKDK